VFTLDPAAAFYDDMETVEPFYLGQIHAALEQLCYQPVQETRNRKALRRAVKWCPEASHSLRVGEFRVLYRIVDDRVALRRLGRKARERLLPVRMKEGEVP